MAAFPSAICGIVIGILYGVAGYATHLLAVKYPKVNFTVIVFGGMLVRLVLAMTAVMLLISVMKVRIAPFFLSLLAAFIGALAIEIVLLHRSALNEEKSQFNDHKNEIIDHH